MPKLLTVDDSKAIRLIVSRHMKALNIEVEEAEDGQKGLDKLASGGFDLVLLDVTMPNMDGPTMLRAMRERGDNTPVLMLTSESKKSTMVEVMRLGIEDYVLKPFKAEEIQAKVKKIMGISDAGGNGKRPAAKAKSSGDRKDADILVVDDMVNVEKKFRKLVPERLTVHGALDQPGAIAQCRKHVYRLVLVDTDIPDTDSKALMSQLRMLESKTAFVALCMRTRNDAERWAKDRGYDDALYKPFSADSVSSLLMRYFDDPNLVVANDNLVRIGSFDGPESGIEKYYSRVVAMLTSALEQMAAACFDEAILDITDIPLSQERTPRFVMDVRRKSNKFGLELRIVGTAEGQRILQQFTDTGSVPFFCSVAEARSA